MWVMMAASAGVMAQKEVFMADFVTDFDVGAVQSSDGQGAV